jgi:Zn-dependent peptidase ImmA (M78 family)
MMAAAQSKIPKTVRVGTQTWEIIEQKRKHSSEFQEGTYGYTIDRDNTIIIDSEMPIGMKRVTLFHELLHAIRFIYGGSYKPKKDTSYEEWEHYWIGIYEEPVILMLHNNPELVAFLLSKE